MVFNKNFTYNTLLITSLTCLICPNLYSIETSKYISKVKKIFTPAEKEILTKEFSFDAESNLEVIIPKGNITIKTWNNNKLLIELEKRGTPEEIKATKAIFKELEKEKTLRVIVSYKSEDVAYTNLNILLPKSANLKSICTDKGVIKVEDIDGSIQATIHEGDIDIKNSTNSVNAKADRGSITVRQKQLQDNCSIFLETLSGDINLYLPKETNADLNAKTNYGKVTSELFVTTRPITTKLNKNSWKQFTKEACGTLGDGGAPITLDADRGNIGIYEY